MNYSNNIAVREMRYVMNASVNLIRDICTLLTIPIYPKYQEIFIGDPGDVASSIDSF